MWKERLIRMDSIKELEEMIGEDILLVDGDFVRALDGDFEVVTGFECLVQEIKNEVITEPGDLFYDEKYGYGLLKFMHAQGDELTQLELTNRIQDKLSLNEFVDPNSIEVEVLFWNLERIKIIVKFEAMGEAVELEIDIADRVKVEVVNV